MIIDLHGKLALLTGAAGELGSGFTVLERDRRAGSHIQPQYEQNVPLRRRGTDLDVANAVAFLASDLTSFVTVACLQVCDSDVMPTS
jgi:3-oxoacyl-[acyl-carrier protein] reductase